MPVSTPKTLASVRLDEARFPRYRNIPQPSRMEWMAGEIRALVNIARIRDFRMEDSLKAAAVLDEVILDEPDMADLTLPEFHDAFRSGVFGKFGEFRGISAPNLYGFIRSFLESEKKRDAAAIVRKTREEAFAERKRREIEERQARIRREVEEAKRNGFVPTGKAWYKTRSVNDIMDSSEHRKRIEEQAREILGK